MDVEGDAEFEQAMAEHRRTSERAAADERAWATERGYLTPAQGAGREQLAPRLLRWARWPWSWT